MERNLYACIFFADVRRSMAFASFFLLAGVAFAQIGSTAAHSTEKTVPALLVSDVHFDPFWDPGKVPSLAAAPVSQWKAILSAPPSPDRERRFAALQQSCGARGADTSFPLLESSLKAMRAHAAGAKFVAVSGDLIAHDFSCKYEALLAHPKPGDYKSFVEKTLDYVIEELRGSFPGVPVYAALGNNDSDCGDYRLDARSEFLSVSGKEVTGDSSASERSDALESFSAGGYYSVPLPAPIAHARLLVLNDLFMSKKYRSCAGKADPGAAEAQLAWLLQQLSQARHDKEKIWVMAHIPPGVDLHSTVTKLDDVCDGQGPEMFLSSEKLADELAEFDDVVQLAIFAHTHMDEVRLLKPDNSNASPASRKGVAVKMVSSISPIDGNNPSFTVVQIDSASAALADYRVYEASNRTGVDAAWTEEYDFARTYGKAAFTPTSVSELIAGFAADAAAKTEASRSYISDFSLGYLSPVLKAFWPQYVCSLSNRTPNAYRSCVCSTAGK